MLSRLAIVKEREGTEEERSTARSDCQEETLDMGLAYDFLALKADAV
jgi:hypothetical protein